MIMPFYFRSAALLVVAFSLAGCATVKNRKTDAVKPEDQVQTMQTELAEKDRRIDELESQLEEMRSAPRAQVTPAAPKSNVIRVPGVTALDVQLALKRAGIDPGPADGRLGSKTKEAIKEFQRRKNLKADGIVGAKTWSLLK